MMRYLLHAIPWLLILALSGCAAPSKSATGQPSVVGRNSAMSGPRSNFSGVWVLDPHASDDVATTLITLRQQRGTSGRTARSEEGGDSSSGGVGSTPDRAVRYQLTAHRLEIAHQEPSLVITPDNGAPRRLYTDNRGTSISARGGEGQRVTTAGWEGDVLVTEIALGNDRIIDRYRLLNNPRRLERVSELPEWGTPDEAVRIRQVYLPQTRR
jgi:hypothetical protein